MEVDMSKKRSAQANNKQEPQRSKSIESAPSAVISILVILLVLVISIASAGIVALLLRDLLASITVFIFTLLVLGIAVPYLGLASGLLSEAVWFKTYVQVLRRVPGLDMIIETLLKFKKM